MKQEVRNVQIHGQKRVIKVFGAAGFRKSRWNHRLRTVQGSAVFLFLLFTKTMPRSLNIDCL